MRSILPRVGGVLVAILALSACSASATYIYNNATNDLKVRFAPNPTTMEVGDEILLATSQRYLTNFSFEFWGTNTASPGNVTFAGAVEARVRFYKNDGPPALITGVPTPGYVLWDSQWFSVDKPTARSTFVFKEGVDFFGLYLPPVNMTWSVQFRGMGATDSIGVDIYSPPVVGYSYDDYWANTTIGWLVITNGVPMNFAAVFEATVPEPGTLPLLALGGVGLLQALRLRRKRSA